jgi:hypothetical protein
LQAEIVYTTSSLLAFCSIVNCILIARILDKREHELLQQESLDQLLDERRHIEEELHCRMQLLLLGTFISIFFLFI